MPESGRRGIGVHSASCLSRNELVGSLGSMGGRGPQRHTGVDRNVQNECICEAWGTDWPQLGSRSALVHVCVQTGCFMALWGLTLIQEASVLSGYPAPPLPLGLSPARSHHFPPGLLLGCATEDPALIAHLLVCLPLQIVCALGTRNHVLFFSVFPHPAHGLAQSRFSIPAGRVGAWDEWMDGWKEGRRIE